MAAKNIIVTQRDAANNEVRITHTITLDTQIPVLSVHSPTQGSRLPSREIIINGSCGAGDSVVDILGDIISSATAPCIRGAFETTVSLNQGDGTKSLTLSQSDLSGNIGRVLLSITLDIAPKIQSHLDGVFVNDKNIKLEGICEPGLDVVLSGDIVGSVSVPCSVDDFFEADIELTSGDGSKRIVATQVGGFGNHSSAFNFRLDTTPPALRFTSHSQGDPIYDTSSVMLQGDCENGSNVTLFGGMTTSETIPCIGNTFQAVVNIIDGGGGKSFTITQRDFLGNEAQETMTLILKYTLQNITKVVSGNSYNCALQQVVTSNVGGKGTMGNWEVEDYIRHIRWRPFQNPFTLVQLTSNH